MHSRICLAFSLIFLIGESCGYSKGACRPRWTAFNDGCYAFSSSALSWEDARKECISHRAALVDIKSKEENNFVGSLSSVDIPDFWIGVRSIACKDVKWWLTSGEAAQYTSWEPDQPNNDNGKDTCVRLNADTIFKNTPLNGWKNMKCDQQLPFACKYYRDPCDEGFTYYNGACYMHEKTGMTWENARKNCQSKNSHLLDVQNAAENNFIRELVPYNVGVYIGASDACLEGTWLELDGTKTAYTNWIPGNPDNWQNNENCVALWTGIANWNDVACTTVQGSICKYTLDNDDC